MSHLVALVRAGAKIERGALAEATADSIMQGIAEDAYAVDPGYDTHDPIHNS